MKGDSILPPGQKESDIYPRFGLPQYANRFPSVIDQVKLSIGGDLEEFDLSSELGHLTRVDQRSDFHCVTTWSKLDLHWSGYRFKEFYSTLIKPKAAKALRFVVLKAQDGYKTSLPLSDLLNSDVLLADRLDDQPLGIEHGAPVRIVAPKHYGYKNIKHLKRIEFYAEEKVVKHGLLGFMDHPRARVDFEERASIRPGIFFRYLYRLGIKKTIRQFDDALKEYHREQANPKNEH